MPKVMTATPSTLRSSMRRMQWDMRFGIVVGGADEDLVAVCYGDIFKSLDQLGEEWVGDLGDDEAKDPAAAGDERACLGVGKVVELVDYLPDALGYLQD